MRRRWWAALGRVTQMLIIVERSLSSQVAAALQEVTALELQRLWVRSFRLRHLVHRYRLPRRVILVVMVWWLDLDRVTGVDIVWERHVRPTMIVATPTLVSTMFALVPETRVYMLDRKYQQFWIARLGTCEGSPIAFDHGVFCCIWNLQTVS